MRLATSLRTRFVVLVVAGAVLPLALIGLWLTRTAVRSGRALLTDRLDGLLESTAHDIRSSWPHVRAELLTLAESPEVRTLLSQADDATSGTVPSGATRVRTTETVGSSPRSLQSDMVLAGPNEQGGSGVAPGPALTAALLGLTRSVTLLDDEGRQVWSAKPPPALVSTGPGLLVRLPVFARGTSDRIGRLEAEVAMNVLLGEGSRRASPLGSVLAVIDPGTGATLLPLPFDPGTLADDRFAWGGDEWIVRRGGLAEPAVHLIAAAPLTPLVAPFDRAARQGLAVLLGAALLSTAIAVLLTGRMTRSLGRLTAAADAVSHGELERTVDAEGDDELGRVAVAFNLMTGNLRRTLRQLADRQALAAVGEFAASLSHEIRNALTSIRLDMQVAGEQLRAEPHAREPYERALQEIGRLEETVTGTLRVARSGRGERRIFDLSPPLRAAIHAAQPEFDRRGARLDARIGTAPIPLAGDPASLEQMFLNLLLNAAQALDAGGRASVRVEVERSCYSAPERDPVRITISDDGPGIPTDSLERVFEPFYSTRTDGTGLGLAIARRIVQAHGGRIRIESEAAAHDSDPPKGQVESGHGCSVIVTLPVSRTERRGGDVTD